MDPSISIIIQVIHSINQSIRAVHLSVWTTGSFQEMEVSLLVEEGEHPSDLVAELELGCRGGTEYYSKLLMWRVNN